MYYKLKSKNNRMPISKKQKSLVWDFNYFYDLRFLKISIRLKHIL